MARRVVSRRTVETTWSCSACRHKNRGRDVVCSSCGKPKHADEQFVIDKTAPTVTDPALLAKAAAGYHWNCRYCQAQNPGNKHECEQCGAHFNGHIDKIFGPKRTNDAPEELKSSQPQRSAEAEFAHVIGKSAYEWSKRSPDPHPTFGDPRPEPKEDADTWRCACTIVNWGTATECTSCGAPQREVKVVLQGGGFRDAPKIVVEAAPSMALPPDPPPDPPHEDFAPRFPAHAAGSVGRLIGAAVVVGIALVATLCVWLFTPHRTTATVSSATWQYERILENRVTTHHQGWDHPISAYNVHCEERQHGTEDCNAEDCNCRDVPEDCNPHDCDCHEECEDEGNGFASCSTTCETCYETCYEEECETCYDQCPVYDDWCDYDQDRWVRDDYEVTSGHGPETRWGGRLRASGDRQRIRELAHYHVEFATNGSSYPHEPADLAEYSRYREGAVWTVETNVFGSVWPLHEGSEQ